MERSKRSNSSNNTSTYLAVVMGVISLSPSFLFFQPNRRPMGIDNLHVILVQFLLLLMYRYATLSNNEEKTPVSTLEPSLLLEEELTIEETPVTTKALEELPLERRRKSKRRALRLPPPPPPSPPSLYEPYLLDRTLYNFLSITSPSSLAFLPPLPSSSSNIPLPSKASLPTWTLIYADPSSSLNVKVLQHPDESKSLYAIQAEFPSIPLRSLLETLCNVETRSVWDKMCQGGETIERIEEGGRRGSVGWIGMKGVAIVKAKDMVLLSMLALLPPEHDGQTLTPRKRIVCATSSFDHPTKRPPTSSYNRMQLNISGFIAEEMGEEGSGLIGRGSRVVQITDLSGLGSWIPSSIIRKVTQSMIPNSLVKLGEAASAFNLVDSRFPIEGDDWLPPLLGSWHHQGVGEDEKKREFTEKEEEALLSDDEASEEEEDDNDEYSSTEASSLIASSISAEDATKLPKDLSLESVLEEIRSVTSKLAALESSLSSSSSSATSTSSPSSNWITSYLYPSSSSLPSLSDTVTGSSKNTIESKAKAPSRRSLLKTIAEIDIDYVTVLGTGVAVAAGVGLIGIWGSRRR